MFIFIVMVLNAIIKFSLVHLIFLFMLFNKSFFMCHSDMLVQTNLILEPDKAEVALLFLIGTVHYLEVSRGIVLVGELLLAHQTPPGFHIFVPCQVFIHVQTCSKRHVNIKLKNSSAIKINI